MTTLTHLLREEKSARRKGGLYHKTQVGLAYNSNKIEGSKLTEEQTRLIFETRTIGFKDQEAVPVDDIIEASNHFAAFDFLLDSLDAPLSSTLIKEFHRVLKTGTFDVAQKVFQAGEWKKLPNEVGGISTALPQDVEVEMDKLHEWYRGKFEFGQIIEHHWRFERIHPFHDGNGRVGRLVMFRECLKNNLVPFIIEDAIKPFYYRGLREFATTRGYLLDTCLSAQDTYKTWVHYFYPDFPTP